MTVQKHQYMMVCAVLTVVISWGSCARSSSSWAGSITAAISTPAAVGSAPYPRCGIGIMKLPTGLAPVV